MRITRITIVWLVAVAIMTGLFASGAFASVTTTRITVVDAAGTQGWTNAAVYGAKAFGLSTQEEVAKGSPGPAPPGFYFMEVGGKGGNGEPPAQHWLGTDKYNGVKLSEITTLSYWTILGFRGEETRELGEDVGHGTTHGEYCLGFLDSQPPAMTLFVKINSGANSREFVYRPWSTAGKPGFGPWQTGAAPTTLPAPWGRWQEWDCLTQGYWLVNNHDNLEMYTWDDLKAAYPDAVLTTPPQSTTPEWGDNPASATGCSLNIVLGARESTLNAFPDPYNYWWKESYSAKACVDLVTICHDAGARPAEEDAYDFQAPGLYLADPSKILIRAMNNQAIFDQQPYAPDPRTRGYVKWSGGPDNPPDWWWGSGTVDASKMNALQRANSYGCEVVGGYNRGHLFVLYGRVCADPPVQTGANNSKWFYVDDGAGLKVKCYCPDGVHVTAIRAGNYLRMLGSLQGNNPYEWYWNNFHYVTWNADPALRALSQPWPWEFQTYRWNVTLLD